MPTPDFTTDEIVRVISNAPDLLLAKRIAHILVEDDLAACVNKPRVPESEPV